MCSLHVPRMGNHGIRQSKRDDTAFPVRVKVAVPPFGLGKELDRAQEWLKREIGPGRFACHSSPGIGCDTAAFYFRDVPAAWRFFDAFPELQLADGTLSPAFGSAVQYRQ